MKKRSFTVATIAASLFGATWALAHEEVLIANFTERAGPNHYSVVFPPELGGQEIILPITSGQFRMAVDPEAGTSSLLAWRQDIEPILINGLSTGQIVVRLDESQPSSGSFNFAVNTFAVTATFILEFDDSQLRDLGFFSPFALTATEQGNIYGSGKIGFVNMYLEGTGQFGLGQFNYTCRTSAEFVYDLPPELGQPGDVNHDRSFDLSDPIAALDVLYLGIPRNCPGAIEVNGDGDPDLSDVIYMIDFIFLGGSPPPLPAVECAVP